MTEYRVAARRIDSHGSLAAAKQAEVVLDTDLAGRQDAMNPVELLLSALAACMLILEALGLRCEVFGLFPR